MKLRLYHNRQADAAAQIQDEEQRQHQRPQPAASEDSPQQSPLTSGQQAILKMQQSRGNQAVQRYLAGRNMLQRDSGSGSGVAGRGRAYIFAMSVVGATQGKFKGASKLPGHEGMIEGMSLQFSTARPKDKNKENNKDEDPGFEVTIQREPDESSAQFVTALTSGETLKSAQIEIIRQDDTDKGKLNTLRKLMFSDGQVTDVEYSRVKPEDAHSNDPGPIERIKMVFKKMSA